MSKATEEDLASLHGAIARELTDIVVEGQSITVGKGDDAQVVRVTAPAAYIMAGIAFLKNNNITADAGSNAELDALTKALQERRKKSKEALSKRTVQEAAKQFERDLGQGFEP